MTVPLKIEYGVPQGPISGLLILGPLCECEGSKIENYADDTTPYACASDINTVISDLQITASKLFALFNNNHMKATLKKVTFF